MTPKQARKKVLLYREIVKMLEKHLNEPQKENVYVGLKYLIEDYKVKLDWAVSDYKLALQNKNGTI